MAGPKDPASCPDGGVAAGSPAISCLKAKLTINVKYDPLAAPIKDVKVTIAGPVTKSEITDAAGVAKFADLTPGSYSVAAEYVGKDPLVDFAAKTVGKTDWAWEKKRAVPSLAEFPVGSNKCNLFVYEMVTGAGYSVPTKTHERKLPLVGITVDTVQIPPNAGDWASPTATVGSSKIVGTPEPGDIIAWRHNYSDATGHVGIVSYPQPSKPASKTLAAGDDATTDVTMRRQTISAGHKTVDEDGRLFWHYWDEGNSTEMGNVVFRRLK